MYNEGVRRTMVGFVSTKQLPFVFLHVAPMDTHKVCNVRVGHHHPHHIELKNETINIEAECTRVDQNRIE